MGAPLKEALPGTQAQSDARALYSLLQRWWRVICRQDILEAVTTDEVASQSTGHEKRGEDPALGIN